MSTLTFKMQTTELEISSLNFKHLGSSSRLTYFSELPFLIDLNRRFRKQGQELERKAKKTTR